MEKAKKIFGLNLLPLLLSCSAWGHSNATLFGEIPPLPLSLVPHFREHQLL
jgi:hypothetical protein